jgi:FMN hydrolase / 5-amino-6-(5-phospho-D-ribitylamino)uracil phosphatase
MVDTLRNSSLFGNTQPTPFEPGAIQAISLDLDDTLWPIGPTIERAELALHHWLAAHAPMAAALFANPHAVRDIREQVMKQRPEIRHDLSAVRREAIRLGLYRAGENPLRADEAFEVFFAERQRVNLYPEARAALQWLGQRYPLIALSNGNADLERVGLGGVFTAALSARGLGFGKPDPRSFAAVAQAAGVGASAVLHVGDDVALDVLGALRAGMPAVWLNRNDALWPYDDEPPTAVVTDLVQLCDLLDAAA